MESSKLLLILFLTFSLRIFANFNVELVTDRTASLELERNLFIAMNFIARSRMDLQSLGVLNWKSYREKLNATFAITKEQFSKGEMDLINIKQDRNLKGSIFFYPSKYKSKKVIEIEHLIIKNITNDQSQLEFSAYFINKALPLMLKKITDVNTIIINLPKGVEVYDILVRNLGFKSIKSYMKDKELYVFTF